MSNDINPVGRNQNPTAIIGKTHPDIARQKAGEGWVLRQPKGGRQRSE
jgi:hypothetical protein